MLSDSGQSFTVKYGMSDYKSLLFAGYIAWTFANAALVSSVNNITGELSRGTFYRKIKAHCPLPLLQVGELCSTVLVNYIVAAVVALVGWFAWGLHLYVTPGALVAIIICSLGMYGIGLILDDVVIRYKQTEGLLFLVQLGLLFATELAPLKRRHVVSNPHNSAHGLQRLYPSVHDRRGREWGIRCTSGNLACMARHRHGRIPRLVCTGKTGWQSTFFTKLRTGWH